MTARLSVAETADRAGVDAAFVSQLVSLGILTTGPGETLDPIEVRKIGVVQAMRDGGLPLDGVAEGIRRGIVTLDFVGGPEYERFRGITGETFAEAARRKGVPVEQLTVIREALGAGVPGPLDFIRESELPIIDFVEVQHRAGFRPAAIERLLRAMGDSLRRIAEAEAEWWRSEVIDPSLAAGRLPEAIGPELSREMTGHADAAMRAIHQAQEAQTWTANIVGGFERVLSENGLIEVTERQPAICFLDITGYTRLTQERGDKAAAELAEEMNRVVKRSSTSRGGRPVKWLGDGVMFYFREAGPGVVAALEMVDSISATGLPPAHVGLHAGPVVQQEGDYYGQTVNLAARIGDYARPGEVLVSDAVFDASRETAGLRFTDIGAIELKGVSGTVQLHAAHGAG